VDKNNFYMDFNLSKIGKYEGFIVGKINISCSKLLMLFLTMLPEARYKKAPLSVNLNRILLSKSTILVTSSCPQGTICYDFTMFMLIGDC